VNAAQALAGILVVAAAILPYLASQPDSLIPPLAKVVIIALNLGTTALALYLKVSLPGRTTTS
jgi:hypothetical protein